MKRLDWVLPGRKPPKTSFLMAWLNLIRENYCLLTIEDTYYKTHFHLIYAAYLFLRYFLLTNVFSENVASKTDYVSVTKRKGLKRLYVIYPSFIVEKSSKCFIFSWDIPSSPPWYTWFVFLHVINRQKYPFTISQWNATSKYRRRLWH